MSSVFAQYEKDTAKTLKFDNNSVIKKEFHKFKQPIDLDLVNVDQIVVSDKCKHSDASFKYFISYKIVKQAFWGSNLKSHVLKCIF